MRLRSFVLNFIVMSCLFISMCTSTPKWGTGLLQLSALVFYDVLNRVKEFFELLFEVKAFDKFH